LEPTQNPAPDRTSDFVLSDPAIARAARWGIVVWTLIGLAILGYLLFRYVLSQISILFPIAIVATVLVYLMNPLVTGLERRGLGRGWGTALIYVVFFIVFSVVIAFLVPIVLGQVRSFADSVPDLASRAVEWLHTLLDRAGVDVRFTDVLAEIQQGGSIAGGFIERATSLAGGVLQLVFIFVVGPVLAFYLTVDLPKMKASIGAAIPMRKQDEWRPVADQVGAAVGGFFRGQLVVASFVALASMLVLYIIGLPYWAVVGVVAGIFNLVPMIGPYIGGVVAIFIAFTASESGGGLFLHPQPGLGLAVASIIALFVVQQLDNHIVSPNVVARTVKLHPVTVMVSLLAFGALFGFWGLLLAVPTTATIKILIVHYWDTRVQWPPDERSDAGEPGSASGSAAAVGEEAGTAGGFRARATSVSKRLRRKPPKTS